MDGRATRLISPTQGEYHEGLFRFAHQPRLHGCRSSFRIGRDHLLMTHQPATPPRLTHAECENCGWVGPLSEAKEHPERPHPMDGGFCPECMNELRFWITAEEAQAILDEYDA